MICGASVHFSNSIFICANKKQPSKVQIQTSRTLFRALFISAVSFLLCKLSFFIFPITIAHCMEEDILNDVYSFFNSTDEGVPWVR